MTDRRTAWRTFGAPLLIAIVSLAGLVGALLVGLDLVAGLAVGVSLPAVAWAFLRRR